MIYIQDKNLGFDRNQIILLPLDNEINLKVVGEHDEDEIILRNFFSSIFS